MAIIENYSVQGSGNTGDTGILTNISGKDNDTNSGNHCLISGKENDTNSGNNCSISGRSNHTNSADKCSISGGGNNTNSGENCSISGEGNNANSGYYCSISGQNNYFNTGDSCSISGRDASSNNLDYSRVHGGGTKARLIDVVVKANTTDATPKSLTANGATETADTAIVIPVDTAWEFTAHIVAKDSTSANAKKLVRSGLIGNDGGTVTISTIDTIGTDRELGSLAVTVAITADTTLDALKIQGTGIAATTIDWACQVNITQVG